MLKAVIFDFDGVIADTFDLAFGISSELYPGITVEEYRKFFDGNLYTHPALTHEKNVRFEAKQAKLFEELVVHDHVLEHLANLKKKYELFIITSNREDALEICFERNKMRGLFCKVLGKETERSKVKKFQIILEKYSPDECVFVTDTVGDVLEAREVGVRAIAVDFGFHERERLEKASPYAVVSSFDEVVSLIESL